MNNELDKEIIELRKLLFKYDITNLLQTIPNLLTKGLTMTDNIDGCKKIILDIYSALQNKDYLLAVDILEYKFKPLCR